MREKVKTGADRRIAQNLSFRGDGGPFAAYVANSEVSITVQHRLRKGGTATSAVTVESRGGEMMVVT